MSAAPATAAAAAAYIAISPVEGIKPPSITTGGFMPSTGDMAMYAAAAAAVAGAALIVVALLVKRGGGSHKE